MRRSVFRPLASRWIAAVSVAALSAVALMGAAGSAAQAADTVFDWGDNDKTVDSGKAHIKFTGPAHVGDIIVSFGDRKLYFITGQGEADTYPIAIPRDQSRWEGVTTVSQKRENPSWTPTPHMMAENPRLPRWVPGGHPMNPLGIRALYLGSSDYRIHGTDAPWTIGSAASKGCVRMFNKDVVDLYPRVKVGSKVTVTWQKFDSNTLAMAEHAKAVSDPDPDHGHGGKVFAATYAPDETPDGAADGAHPLKVRAHKAVVNESEPVADTSEDKVGSVSQGSDEEQVKPKAASVSEDAPGKAAFKNQAGKDQAGKDQAGKDQAGKEQASKDQSGDVTSKSAEVSDADKAERKARRAAKRAARVETSSLQSDEATDEASALIVAKRAVAAAEKAAKAAERAAAAAERAAAATQQDHAAPAAITVPSSGTVQSY